MTNAAPQRPDKSADGGRETARVIEEVALRKEAVDRTETIRDTDRKEEVEVEQVPDTSTTTSGATSTPLQAET